MTTFKGGYAVRKQMAFTAILVRDLDWGGVILFPNASSVLDSFGVYERIRGGSLQFDAPTFKDGRGEVTQDGPDEVEFVLENGMWHTPFFSRPTWRARANQVVNNPRAVDTLLSKLSPDVTWARQLRNDEREMLARARASQFAAWYHLLIANTWIWWKVALVVRSGPGLLGRDVGARAQAGCAILN
ncbi:hypothetical protein CIB48_g9598 [Xylaria polymorpha]|nr:hypothetical protein CIB48_g9598 [Xylaria polymorpha]